MKLAALLVKLLGGWRATLFAVLAVAALLWCVFLRAAGANDRLRAHTAEERAARSMAEVASLKMAAQRDEASAQATAGARKAADARQNEREARQKRVEGMAHAPAADLCAANPDLLRELQAGAKRVSAAEDRLRGH